MEQQQESTTSPQESLTSQGEIKIERPSENISSDIEIKSYNISGSPILYYVSRKHQTLMEEICPHDRLTLDFPFDTSSRGVLGPIGFLCKKVEYCGLDMDSHSQMCRLQSNGLIKLKELESFISASSLDDFTSRFKGEFPQLYFIKVGDKKVYFPTAAYVLGNKSYSK